MSLLRLYTRVLELLGKEARLGWILAVANLLLAAAQFAEPVLFGRIVDVLSGKTGSSAWPLLAAWAAFGLFTIGISAVVALHADRLAHRQRQVVLANYFEHIMQLPMTFHSGTHSGRLMKVMLNGADALWRLWLGFFREHFAAIMSVVVLLPLSIYINWRLAILLFVLCVVFTAAYHASWCARPTACRARSRSITAAFPPALPMRSAMSRWCRASSASATRCRACASSPTSCWRCRCLFCHGGRW